MAKDRPLQELTYREKIRDATHLARELIDHASQAMLPRMSELQTLLKPRKRHKEGSHQKEEEPIEDLTIRNAAAFMLESESYARQLCDRMDELGTAIVVESTKIAYNKE
jgi:hypothetical protein